MEHRTVNGLECEVYTLAEYRAMVTLETCPDCGCPLPDGLKHYDHDGGLLVVGFSRPQWLFLECPNCDYQWALWKLLRRQLVAKESIQ